MAEATIQTSYADQFSRGLWHYYRSRFVSAGQDSFSNPPSQSEDLFERLLNVMPPVKGDLDRRWGYRLFSIAANSLGENGEVPAIGQSFPMYLYADDPFTFRCLIVGNNDGFALLEESGLNWELGYNVGAPDGRGLTSRGVFYWADGRTPIWFTTGPVNTALTSRRRGAWGISTAGISAGAVGPLPAGAVSSDASGARPWLDAVAAPITTTSGAFATIPSTTYSNATGHDFTVSAQTSLLTNEDYGFTLPLDSVVSGIEVTVWVSPPALTTVGTFNVPPNPNFTVHVSLQKLDGTIVGTRGRTFPLTVTSAAQTFGGVGDLWDTTWNTADFNGSEFGVVISYFFGWTVPAGGSVKAQQVQVTQALHSATGYADVKLYGAGLPISAAVGSAGQVTLISGRQYSWAFSNDALSTYSDLGPFSNSSGPCTDSQIDITGIPTSPDPQVTTVLILGTADGGDETTLYEVGRVPNGTATFTDDSAEETLLLVNQFQAELIDGTDVGLADNTPPPAGLRYPTLHRGRIYGVVGNNLYYSKSDDELLTPTGILAGRFEQAWPALNFFPVSNLGEKITGLLSDGTVLYIGTDRRVIRLFGDGPATFLQPDVLFDNVGVLNQDCWKLVLLEGNPVGAMWLTPDYRVIGSDFNTYQDVGTPIQNVLDSINKQALIAAWASYVGISVFNLFVLAVPTGGSTQPDTLLVFDVKGKHWYEWQLTDVAVAGFWWVTLDGVPQFVFQSNAGKFYAFDPDALQDREGEAPVGFPAQMKTSWLGMGDQTSRKNLNEIEIMTGDPDMLLTVEGASSVSDFSAPRTVVLNAPLVTKPRGELGVFLAGAQTRDRFYRFTFDSSSTATTDLLRAYSIVGRILHNV